jgi:hypothetical protein
VDLPTGRRVDWVKFDRPATSRHLSPASDMMAMANVGNLYLWTNKTLYERVALRPVREEVGPQPQGLPDHMLVTEGQEAGAMEVEEASVGSLFPADLLNCRVVASMPFMLLIVICPCDK